jgi:hypothetical protein
MVADLCKKKKKKKKKEKKEAEKVRETSGATLSTP